MSDPASVPGDAGASQAPPTPRTESNEPSELRPSTGAAPGDNGGEAAGEDRPRSNTRRRRGSRGGRGRGRQGQGQGQGAEQDGESVDTGSATGGSHSAGSRPDGEGNAGVSGNGASDPPAGKPKIGDSRPAPVPAPTAATPTSRGRGNARSGRSKTDEAAAAGAGAAATAGGNGDRGGATADGGAEGGGNGSGGGARRRRRRGGRGRGSGQRPAGDIPSSEAPELDAETLELRRGRERKGRPVGRYLMCVHMRPHATQIAVMEGRALIEHYVSRPSDDVTQIDGNIYLGRVQNVLPGMEAAFVDIGTPKNAVLYRGDVRYDKEDVVEGGPKGREARIEDLLKPGQTILCQVTKNPIGTKGARLTQEVSLPGRFCVLIPNSDTYGISKRLTDDERKRLRRILDEVRPPGHGLIVRTAAEGATADELRRDMARLLSQWESIDGKAKRTKAPALLYREPDMAVRVIREEFNKEYRGVVIDDPGLYADVREYVEQITPELADRVEQYDESADGLPIFERYHVHEQLHKALDRKVWLPSGGSLIIERTEALTVIDVNTGKNVGTSNLEETVYRNNLEAAEEIARQLRLRDIGGIIVIDFIDMEIASNRADVLRSFKAALARDKTRTQVFEISELGLVQMTRKRISEGLVESFSTTCPACNGRGIVMDETLL